MIIYFAVACAVAEEKRIKNALLFKRRVIVCAAHLEGGAGGFVKANVEIELGHWKNAGLEGQLRPEADAGSAG